MPETTNNVTAKRSAHRSAKPRGGLREYFANIRRAVNSSFEGMSVTMSWMFRRPMTVQYPDKIEKPVQEMLPESYRGILEVDLGRCTGCLLCAKACPIDAIRIDVQKNPETGVRELCRFDIDMGLCMYCGLCCEACNFDSIAHTPEFEGTVESPDELVLRFVKNPRPVSRHKANEGPARRPRGSILPEVIPSLGRRKAWQAPEEPAAPAPAAPSAPAEPAAPAASVAPAAPAAAAAAAASATPAAPAAPAIPAVPASTAIPAVPAADSGEAKSAAPDGQSPAKP